MSRGYKPQLRRTDLTGTNYVGLNLGGSNQGLLHVSVFSGTPTLTLQLSGYDSDDAPQDADETVGGNEHMWANSTVTVAAPAAPGATVLPIQDTAGLRVRLKIVGTCNIEILARPCNQTR